MFDLTGKGALVTGATGGIGGAIAKVLHAQGANVVVSGTKAERLEALAAELGSRVFVLPCDLRDRGAVAALADTAEKTLRPGRYPRQQRRHHPRQSLHAHEGRGVGRRHRGQPYGRVPCSRARILRGMMKKRWGRIVTITSIVGRDRQSGAGQLRRCEGGT